jgi:uncharacterized membrane protein YfcA
MLPVYGFAVGVLVGLTGLGGGILMTPLLMLGFGMPAATAVGTDLVYATLTKIAGTWQHWRQGTVDWRVVRRLAAGSLPATLVAVIVLVWLREHNADQADGWLERAIGVALIVAALLMIQRLFAPRRDSTEAKLAEDRVYRIVAVGALGGFMVGLTSIGSGSLIMALLVFVTPLRPDRLVGTDIAHATFLLGVAAVAHLAIGDVDPGVVFGLVLGSVPGVLVGSKLTPRVPRRPLQMGLAGLLVTTGARLLR